MLYFMAVWLLLLAVCGVVGIALLNSIQAKSIRRMGDRVAVSIWLGIVILAIALLAVSLVLPLSPGIGAVVTLGLCGIALRTSETRRELRALKAQMSKRNLAIALVLIVAIAAFTTRQVTWIDTGLYHYSAIQWLSQFGTVTGLALLFDNLGFTSAWFAFSAPLNPASLDARVTAVSNGFALWVAVLHLWICIQAILDRRGELSDWFLSALLLFMLSIVLVRNPFRSILLSASPDLLLLFLIAVVAWSILVIQQGAQLSASAAALGDRAVVLIVAVGAVAIKLVALPLLPIAYLFFVSERPWNVRRIMLGSAIAGLLLLPFFTASIMTSGCPLFPSRSLCLELPWSFPSAKISEVSASTIDWTTWYGEPPQNVNLFLWLLWNWFKSERENQLMAFFTLLSAIALVLTIRWMAIKRRTEFGWLMAIALGGAVFFMKTSPILRFSLAYLLILPALIAALFGMDWIHRRSANRQVLHLANSRSIDRALPLVCYACTAAIVLGLGFSRSRSQLLLPLPLKSVPVTEQRIENIVVRVPIDELCWATEIPCAFEAEDISLRDPDQGVSAGFVRPDEL